MGVRFLYTGYGAKRVFCFLSLILSSIISCFFSLSFFFFVLALSGVLFFIYWRHRWDKRERNFVFLLVVLGPVFEDYFQFLRFSFLSVFFFFFLFLFLAGWRMASMFFFFFGSPLLNFFFFFYKCGMEFFLSDKWWGRGARGVAVFSPLAG